MKLFRASNVLLILLCAMYFITYLDRVNVSTAAQGFGPEFGLNKTQIGLVFSAFAWPYLVLQIIGGWVSDRFGARRTLIACGLVWAAATALTGMATGLAWLIAARVLLGLGEGATFPAATCAMSHWFAKERRGFAQGLTHAASRAGNTVTPILVAVVMGVFDWRASFYACAVISFIWVGLWALTFTERPADHPRITQEELDAVAAPNDDKPRVPWGPLFRRMMPVTVVYFCYGWTLWLFLSWLPQYFLHNYHLDLKNSALFSSAVFGAGVIGDTLGGIVTDRLYMRTGNLTRARSGMVAVCMLFALLSLVPLLFLHSLVVSVVCLSAGFFFAEMTIGPMWAIPMDIAPAYSGTASGMMNTGSALAAIVCPVVSGKVIDWSGNWELPFVGSMFLMGLGIVLAFRMRPEKAFEANTGELALQGAQRH